MQKNHQWPYRAAINSVSLSRGKLGTHGRRTKEADLVPSPVVLHEELVSCPDVLVKVPGRRCRGPRLAWELGQVVEVTDHAMASSAVFASHVIKGLTTPGLKKVPTPGWEAGYARSGYDRKFNRDGSKG